MESQFQPYIKDVCRHCGMALWDCEDWLHSRWEDECWDGCLHEAANDPELAQVASEIDAITNRINHATQEINFYRNGGTPWDRLLSTI